MSNSRTEFGFERTECDCEECIQFCVSLPGSLIPADLEAISGRLGYDDLVQFAVENLLASPGAIVSDGKNLIRIPTLVPQRGADGACKFLRDSRCSIHAQAPYSCAFFEAGQDQHEATSGAYAVYRRLRGNGRQAAYTPAMDAPAFDGIGRAISNRGQRAHAA